MVSAQKKKIDTVKVNYFPTGIRLGTDLLSIIKAGVDHDYKGWEVNADVDVSKYYVAVDYGTWGKTASSDARQYQNDGKYWRAGVDINLLKKDPDKNMFFFGARYASGTFWERLTTSITDPVYGNKNFVSYYNPNATAHWVEIVTGLKVKIWKEFWMGYTARYKFSLSTDNTPGMIPADVPGYGRNDGATWGFNYQIFWRIPIRKIKSTFSEK